MLNIEHLDACYGESRVITDLSLEVSDKRIVCLIGRNGVGKSTTLKSVMGLVKNPTGRVILDGEDISQLNTYDRSRKGIGYVPQGREIFSRLTVQENLEIGLRARGDKGSVPEYLYDLFPILPKFAKRKGGDLSGGQQQQLAIARALVTKPKILILDEPTEGIQPSIIENIGDAIRTINRELGITVLIVEQYLDFVLGISDELYVMEHGGIVFHDQTANIKAEQVQRIMTTGSTTNNGAYKKVNVTMK
ncbi:MAG: urea ABC transporter ATP-binding subunit UrtE [Oscillospiraceae bacterium]|nr:urea ABC transporter ATP-binding subunit UrtE [Oscillospiraceae bacterium]